MSVVVAYLTPDQTNAHFVHCLDALLWHDSHNNQEVVDVIRMISSPRIASSRNEVVRGFLDHPENPDWLLFLDSDMVFDATTLDRLLEWADPNGRPILGGLCFAGGRSGEIRPTMMVMVESHPPTFDTVWNYEPDALNGVDATGAACLLIHRSVLEDLGKRYETRAHRWFAESEIEGREYGEDTTFCMRARAAGYRIYVHTGIEVGHMKMTVLDQQAYLTWRRGITEHGQDEFREMELARRGVKV